MYRTIAMITYILCLVSTSISQIDLGLNNADTKPNPFILALSAGPELTFSPDENTTLNFGGGIGVRSCFLYLGALAERATIESITFDQIKNITSATILKSLFYKEGNFHGSLAFGFVIPLTGGGGAVQGGGFSIQNLINTSSDCSYNGISITAELNMYSLIDSISTLQKIEHRSFGYEGGVYIGGFFQRNQWNFRPLIGFGTNTRLDRVFDSNPIRLKLDFNTMTPFIKNTNVRVYAGILADFAISGRPSTITLTNGDKIEKNPVEQLAMKIGVLLDIAKMWN